MQIKLLIIFVEVTTYNIARIHNVYEKNPDWKCRYVYCSQSVSGHITGDGLPSNTIVLEGKVRQKLKSMKEILKEQYDFIIVNGYSDLFRLYVIHHAKRKRIPYAIETDTQLKIPQNAVKRVTKKILLTNIFKGNAYGFAGGSRQKELFYYYNMNESHVKVLPMTVEISRFNEVATAKTKEEYKNKHGYRNKKVILYAGRFEKEKDLITLMKAAEILRRKYDDFILCLIGKGSQLGELKKISNNIEGIVYFLDYKLMPELAEFYALADVFVLPSEFEPWGLAVNESLACHTPVIVSDRVGAADDLITPGENGELFQCGNIEMLAMKLEKWLYHRPKQIDFSINDFWNYQTYVNVLEDTLEGIVHNR